jgi:hypothetical protein
MEQDTWNPDVSINIAKFILHSATTKNRYCEQELEIRTKAIIIYSDYWLLSESVPR